MINQDTRLLEIENAHLLFLNFAGREGQYNREGDRNFCVQLDEDVAQDLRRDGWNVKTLKAREPDDLPKPYLEVAVSFKGPRPPRIILVTSRSRSPLDESMCELVDYVDIKTVDLIVRPYDWTVNGKTGTKAYLKSIYVVVQEDKFELKYADLEEISAGGQQRELPAAEEHIVIEGEYR